MNKAIVYRMPITSGDCIFSSYIDDKHHCLLRLI